MITYGCLQSKLCSMISRLSIASIVGYEPHNRNQVTTQVDKAMLVVAPVYWDYKYTQWFEHIRILVWVMAVMDGYGHFHRFFPVHVRISMISIGVSCIPIDTYSLCLCFHGLSHELWAFLRSCRWCSQVTRAPNMPRRHPVEKCLGA